MSPTAVAIATAGDHHDQAAGLLFLTAAGVAAVLVYAVSLRLFPFTNCRSCSGSGKTRDRIFRGAFGACRRCAGSGRKARLGVRLFRRKV